ncbi:MAG: arsenite efflux transporter metallochaperone ArsD [Acidobacteria bacterium]|nr:arsenite efflux transporter metallochaperone ArsD [Acidobacteriota bacterium]
MKKLEVFDPPMCCATGVCGTDINPVLPRFAADLEWLKTQGIQVQRYNLAQQPGDFVANETVRQMLHEQGNNCLPLILVNGQIMGRAAYPDRVALAGLVGIDVASISAESAQPKRALNVLPSESRCC